tara:strand:- start:9899 stop:10306 length:408 start_codon:yes stop_codon:yes gene_type:complete
MYKSYNKESLLAMEIMKNYASTFILVLISSLLTFELHFHFVPSPVLSSCIIGLCFTLIPKRFETHGITYCGSFIGMTLSLFGNYPLYFLVAAMITSITFIASKNRVMGYGGKLGSIAFLGSFASYLLIKVLNASL